eukprot:1153088-Pelagomonas_calceolata.AAC.4
MRVRGKAELKLQWLCCAPYPLRLPRNLPCTNCLRNLCHAQAAVSVYSPLLSFQEVAGSKWRLLPGEKPHYTLRLKKAATSDWCERCVGFPKGAFSDITGDSHTSGERLGTVIDACTLLNGIWVEAPAFQH